MNIGKASFFSSVANLLKPFLTAYQTRDPVVPFLYDDLYSLKRKIMSWFVKRVVLEKANTGAKLLKINLNYQQNILPFNKIHIGFGAQKIMMKFAKMQFSYLKSKYLRKSVLFFLLF